MADENDYPIDEELEVIKNFPPEDFHGCMTFIEPLWERYGSFRKMGENVYRLATGGWSGNESIINALHNNQMFWALYWAESRRGGLFVFAPCTLKAIEELEALHKDNEL